MVLVTKHIFFIFHSEFSPRNTLKWPTYLYPPPCNHLHYRKLCCPQLGLRFIHMTKLAKEVSVKICDSLQFKIRTRRPLNWKIWIKISIFGGTLEIIQILDYTEQFLRGSILPNEISRYQTTVSLIGTCNRDQNISNWSLVLCNTRKYRNMGATK